jgi:hypothetical protein
VSQDHVPGVAIDASGAHAYVVDASGTVAAVDLSALSVSYHTLTVMSHVRQLQASRVPLRAEKGDHGPIRTARWLGDGLLLVSGSNLQDTTQRLQSDAAGLWLVDTRNWTETALDSEADSFAITDGLLLATGARWLGNSNPTGMGLVTFGADARPRLRLFVGRAVGVERVLAGRAYVYGYGWKRDRVVDLRSGRVIGSRSDNLPEPLLETGSSPLASSGVISAGQLPFEAGRHRGLLGVFVVIVVIAALVVPGVARADLGLLFPSPRAH